VPILIKILKNSNEDNVIEQAIWCLGNIAGDGITNRDYLLQCNGLEVFYDVIMGKSSLGILRNSTWALSNLCRGHPAPAWNLISPVLRALSQLIYNTDDEILADTCWSLAYLSEGSGDTVVQAIIEAGVVRRLGELLSYNVNTVQTPALRAIGNICTSHDLHTQVLLNCGVLPKFSTLLVHTRLSIRKEALWTLSNITAGNCAQIQAVLDSDLIPSVVKALNTNVFDERKEAAWVIANITSGNDDTQIKFIVDHGALEGLCHFLLDCDNTSVLSTALKAIYNIILSGERMFGLNNYYVEMLLDTDMIDLEVYERDSNTQIKEDAMMLRERMEKYERLMKIQEEVKKLLKKRLNARQDPFKDVVIFT
jgi:importin subunit alpha-1